MLLIVFVIAFIIMSAVGYALGRLILLKWEDVVFKFLDNTIGRMWQC